MAGYTPLFDSLTKGTLCGKWPDIGLWPIVLSMADRHGVVDVTHQYIATITGLDIDEVVACMERFCQPDPHSRSQENQGARLALLDEHRSWGWRVVNHGKYTEKARLIHKNAREVEEGKNRKRLAERRATADDRRGPPLNAPQSQAQSQSQEKKTVMGGKPPPHKADPPEFLELKAIYPKRSGDQRWRKALQHCRARLKEGHAWDEILDGARRYAAWCKATDKIGTETVKQAATFVGTEKGFTEPWTPPKRQLTPIERVLKGDVDERLVN